MLMPTLLMAVMAIVLFVVASQRGHGLAWAGLRQAWKTTLEIMPLLLLAFLVAGLVQVLIPKGSIGNWIGDSSGIKGILIGAVVGGLSPGGPYVSLPLAAGLFQAGAGIGTMVAYLTGWSLWAVTRLPMEFGILGWRLTVIRLLSTLSFPVIAGVFANWLAKVIR